MQFPFEEQNRERSRASQVDRPYRVKPRKHNIKASGSKEIARATFISMVGFFMAKVTGFLREVLIGPKLGFGMYSDPYYVAFFIPDLLYALLLGGAVAAAITPTLSAGIEENKEQQVWRSVSIFISISSVVMLVVLLFVGLLMPWLLPAINPGKAPEILEAAIPISRILLIQSLFMTLISLTQGILTAYKRFGLAAFGVMLYNILYMIVLLTFGEQSFQGLKHVAWGVVGSASIYFLYQLILARREIRFFKFNLDYRDSGFKRLLFLAVPTLISGSVLHLNFLVMNAFTNQFVGATTSIRQAEQVFMLPYGIIAVAIGTVMLPNMTGFYAKRDYRQVRSLYTKSIRKSLFYIAPIAVIFFVMSFETIQLIFQWNIEAYTMSEVAVTASVLKWFCISLIAQTIIYMTNQAFYARKVTRISLFIGLVTLIFNPIFCVIFTRVFDFGVQGIAMAHAAYSLISALIVYFLYKAHKPKAKPHRILPFLLRIFYCMLITGLVLFAINLIPIRPIGKVLQVVVYLIKSLLALFVFYTAGISIQLSETVKIQKFVKEKLGFIR
ncbi:MAG TPA: lipid II flippase MurJ [Candidatus Eisenbacteria bacterium]|nr:lipid II flippase MurJ [Candidatus Eisenbacteria bacterium]